MERDLGDHAKKWLEMILSYRGDPSKFGLPDKVFNYPEECDDVEDLLNLVKNYWQHIDNTIDPFYKIDEIMPYWAVFALPRRSSTVYLAVWHETLKSRDEALYQDVRYHFKNLIQNYIREELLLFKLVRSFRKVLSHLKNQGQTKKEQIQILNQFTSPDNLLQFIAEITKNNPLKIGITTLLLIERFSVSLRSTTDTTKIQKLTSSFVNNINKMKNMNVEVSELEPLSKSIKEDKVIIAKAIGKGQNGAETDSESQKANSSQQREKLIDNHSSSSPEKLEFEKIELQEYDGYVEITGYSDIKNRNFRIYNCEEEDKLREEMWKGNKYPIRKIVAKLLNDRYSRGNTEYSLKWGVKIEILDPNWLT